MKSRRTAPSSGPFGEPAYRAWFFSQTFSAAGTQTYGVAAAWVIFLETESGLALSMLVVASMGPVLLLGIFTGAALDRFGRRAVLLVSQSVQMLVSATLGIICVVSDVSVPVVLALALLAGTANAFDAPARQVIVVDLVGPARLGAAVPLYEVSLSLARVLGPAVGGVLLTVSGPAACFFFNAVSFIPPLIVLAIFRPRYAAHRSSDPAPRGALLAGVRFAFGSPSIRVCLTLALLVGAVVSTQTYYPLFASDELGLDSGGYGLLVACLGLGSLPGAVMTARIAGAKRGKWVTVAGVATACAIAAAGLAPSAFLACIAVMCVGSCSIALISLANALTQLTVPDALRGRVMGVWAMVLPGMGPITGIATGAIADAVGSRAVFGVLATLLAATAAFSWRTLRSA